DLGGIPGVARVERPIPVGSRLDIGLDTVCVERVEVLPLPARATRRDRSARLDDARRTSGHPERDVLDRIAHGVPECGDASGETLPQDVVRTHFRAHQSFGAELRVRFRERVATAGEWLV